jgi:signal peptidase I
MRARMDGSNDFRGAMNAMQRTPRPMHPFGPDPPACPTALPVAAAASPVVGAGRTCRRGSPTRRRSGLDPYTPPVDRRSTFGCLFEIVETLVLTLVIFFVIQNFVAQPYQVQQMSMERTLEPGQYVLVDKLTPHWDSYRRGDVIVFNPPESWTPDPTPFIKRVIGLPGDTVQVKDDGNVYVNGVNLDEHYLFVNDAGRQEPTVVSPDQGTWVVPPGDLFVMGDHRQKSADSRVFGPISVSNVIGRAFLRYWPISTLGILQTPTYPSIEPATP